MNKVIKLLKNHRSIRAFTSQEVSGDMVAAIVEAAGWAATSNYIQAYSVIRVRQKQTREKIAQLAGGQSWVATSPVFLVFCADLKRAQKACSHEKTKMVSGYTEQFIIATVDVSLAAQNAMIAAESLGLGGVYIGGIRNDPQLVCDLLNIPEHVYPVFGMCLGFPDETQEQKPRLPVNVVLKEEVYQENETSLSEYNEICENYYKGRSKGSRQETWTHQISNMVGTASRPHMRSFLKDRGFEFK